MLFSRNPPFKSGLGMYLIPYNPGPTSTGGKFSDWVTPKVCTLPSSKYSLVTIPPSWRYVKSSRTLIGRSQKVSSVRFPFPNPLEDAASKWSNIKGTVAERSVFLIRRNGWRWRRRRRGRKSRNWRDATGGCFVTTANWAGEQSEWQLRPRSRHFRRGDNSLPASSFPVSVSRSYW